MKTLLAIDGGGLFGVGVANWIPKLDWQFDYYAGTSVGAILAACYALGKDPFEVQKLFNGDLSKRIFTRPGFPRNLNPLRPATYDNREAKKVFQETFGETTVGETKHPLTIVAWNYGKRKEKVFTKKFNSGYYLWEAVLASMSAPGYFPIANIRGEQLGDGGMCGNDPSLAGISTMRDDGLKTSDIKCLSIDTTGKPMIKKINVNNRAKWLLVIIDAIALSNVGYTSYGVKHLLDDRYLRISPDTLPGCPVDNFSFLPEIKKSWEEWESSTAYAFLHGSRVERQDAKGSPLG